MQLHDQCLAKAQLEPNFVNVTFRAARNSAQEKVMKELRSSSRVVLPESPHGNGNGPLSIDSAPGTAFGRLRAPGLEVTGEDLNTFSTPIRGHLTVVECGKDIPFYVARIFYIYGATKDCERGGHAHRGTWQAFIAISGSFTLELTDGFVRSTYVLEEPTRVINVPPMIWARLFDFSKDAVCLVLASSLYDSEDYIREWTDYLDLVRRDGSLDD